MQPDGCMFGMARMDEVFKALGDASRRRLLDSLNARNGQTLRELCTGLDMARQSVSKHLAVLEAANLITTVWRGREKLHYLNAVPINAIAERWINQYDRQRVRALADLKTALEEPMTSTTSTTVSINSNSTSDTEARMVVVRSSVMVKFIPLAADASREGNASRMRSTVSIILA